MSDTESITQMLARWRAGEAGAEDAVARAIYPLLRQVARGQVMRNDGHWTMGATDLAQEAYLRLREQQGFDWRNRQQFFAIAATVVRRVVIDYLRERTADKRGGGKDHVDVLGVEGVALGEPEQTLDWIALDQALDQLKAMDPACARVVELKLFTPMSAEEIAEATACSPATVGRHWRFARNWLATTLDQPGLADVG